METLSVVLDIPARALRTPFTYAVPEDLRERARVGCGVLVDFGHRKAIGWIVGPGGLPAPAELKPIEDVVTEPRFDAVSAEIARWIAARYCAPLSDCLRLWLPGGTVPTIERVPAHGGTTSLWRLQEPSVAAVDERWVELAEESAYVPPANAHLQRAVIKAVTLAPVPASELKAQLGVVDSAIARLSDLGAVRVSHRRRFRAAGGPTTDAPRFEHLSAGQIAALEAVNAASPGDAVLLHGITGSGKTEVYLQAIERVLANGSSAIVLVPEISLTPQAVGRFRARFGDTVAVLHSRLAGGERLDEWDRIASGEARVIVGARSALFAPVRELGLIVIDEEHSASYKQGQAPRYDARDVAMEIARARRCPVVMGSATPSMERLVAGKMGDLNLVEMTDRVGGGRLPEVAVVDMGAEFAIGNRSIFSERLQVALKDSHESGHRSVLLLNRRGFASFLLCRECGYVPMCDSCSTSMTYHHEQQAFLACHHCGARRATPAECPECGSAYLRQFGAGTQRVEHELSQLLPGAPIVRMDADTTKGKRGHERVLAQFEAEGGSILVGTQMVAKGLDYPDVALVGILNADTTLHLPDFRAGERTFQMLEQVSGRAGRSELAGAVILQTYWPEHPAVRAVALHDAEVFYAPERRDRSDLGYPPFGRLANVVVTGQDAQGVEHAAHALADALGNALAGSGAHILGPSPAPLAKVKRSHRWHVLVKAPSGADVASAVSAALESVGRTEGVSFAPDIDPQDLM